MQSHFALWRFGFPNPNSISNASRSKAYKYGGGREYEKLKKSESLLVKGSCPWVGDGVKQQHERYNMLS